MGIEELAVKMVELEEREKTNTHRLDKMEERQDSLDKLVATVEVLANRQETVESDVKEIKVDVKSLNDKPAKRWDLIVTGLISAIVAALAASFLPNFLH